MKKFNFKEAVPVWEKGTEFEKNYTLVFKADIKDTKKTKLFLACSSVYQVFINEQPVAAGPARAAHGFFRVDELDLSAFTGGSVLIYVTGYNTDTFCIQNQPSFLCAEITDGQNIIAATGKKGFQATVLKDRVQKVQRYSYQRAYSEYYRMDAENSLDFSCELINTAEKNFIEREVYYPEYDIVKIKDVVGCGTVFKADNNRPYNDRSLTEVFTKDDGFLREELEFEATKVIGDLGFNTDNKDKAILNNFTVNNNEFKTFELEFDNTGFINLKVEVLKDTRLVLAFDEIIQDDDINYIRNTTANLIVYDLKKGKYNLTAAESYTFKYIRVISIGGSVDIKDFNLIEYKFPYIEAECFSDDERDKKIFNAAIETFRQSTLDIYMDSPSRERAGWLCDSFFMGRVEYALTGKTVVEKNFLENFIHFDKIKNIPDGMLPMLYPGDFRIELFIPNWAMWYVLQLEEYLKRSNDFEMIKGAKSKIYDLVAYFKKFENEYGMLEKLENWVFVEWSKANDYVQDVNFPTNMLYYRMKLAISNLYDDEKMKNEAEELKKNIISLSYKNGFFCDRAIREGNKLKVTDEMTETAQYYAFFTGVAEIEKFSELWNTLKEKFGPERDENTYPQISPSNSFIGNYLRLELLRENGLHEQLVYETRKFFLYMAERTGTLWEHTDIKCSLCHGFASYILLWYCKKKTY